MTCLWYNECNNKNRKIDKRDAYKGDKICRILYNIHQQKLFLGKIQN